MNALLTSATAPGRVTLRGAAWLIGAGLSLAPLQAGGTVTNCSLESLQIALIGGGLVKLECSGTINLDTTIEITRNTYLTAAGYSAALVGGGTNLFPILRVYPGVTLGLHTLTLSDGGATNGGAIQNLGGLVYATNCYFYRNTATGTDGTNGAAGEGEFSPGEPGSKGEPGYGGAIYNGTAGTLNLSECAFMANRATGGKGGTGGAGGSQGIQGGNGGDGAEGAPGLGGAIFNEGTLLLTSCSFTNNTAQGGAGGAGGAGGSGAWSGGAGAAASGGAAAGGAIGTLGEATIVACTFHTNRVIAGAGADGGVAESGNGRAGSDGGTASGGAIWNGGTLTLQNSTLFGNTLAGGNGGAGADASLIGGNGGHGGSAAGAGIANLQTASLLYCTLAANVCTGGTNGAAGDGFSNGHDGQPGTTAGTALANLAGTLSLRNTLLSTGTGAENVQGTVTDLGHNLSSDGSPTWTDPSSRNHTDPRLGTFGDYGGKTRTLPLLPGSPAIDAAATDLAVTNDQRGILRPQGAEPDIGAYERQVTGLFGAVFRWQEPVTNLAVHLVTLQSTNTTTTGADGSYAFTNLDPGAYQIVLAPELQAQYLPAQHGVYLAAINESETNLNFYYVPARLTLTRPTTGKNVLLQGVGAPLNPYRIDFTTGLVSSAWQTLSTPQATTNGTFEITDTNALNQVRRFYRAVRP